MAVTKLQLITAVSAKIVKGLNEAELKKYDECFNYKETVLSCRNTRKIKITMMLPQETNKDGKKFFKYSFPEHIENDNHYEVLDQLSEQVTLLGYANNDISTLTPTELLQQGFVPENGTNIYEIKNMLFPDNYKLIMTGQKSYGPEYKISNEDCEQTCKDIFERENLTIFGKAIAHREIKIGTEIVNNCISD